METYYVAFLVVIFQALSSSARGQAHVGLHGNPALQRMHDQLLEILGLDPASEHSGLVAQALTQSLTQAVPPSLAHNGFSRYGPGGHTMHSRGAVPVTTQGLPFVSAALFMDPNHPMHSFHDSDNAPGVILSPHGGGLVLTPVNSVMFTQHHHYHVANKQQQKQYPGNKRRPGETPVTGRVPSNVPKFSERLLQNLLQHNRELKRQQEQQQRQHLEQQQKSQQQLQQHQLHQQQLLQLLNKLLHEKQQAELRGVDPHTIRSIVRQELEQHRRQQGSQMTAGNIQHIITSLEQARGNQHLSSLTLPHVVALSRSLQSSMGLHHHSNGTVSFLFHFPSMQRLAQAIKSREGLNPGSLANGLHATTSAKGSNSGSLDTALHPSKSLQGQNVASMEAVLRATKASQEQNHYSMETVNQGIKVPQGPNLGSVGTVFEASQSHRDSNQRPKDIALVAGASLQDSTLKEFINTNSLEKNKQETQLEQLETQKRISQIQQAQNGQHKQKREERQQSSQQQQEQHNPLREIPQLQQQDRPTTQEYPQQQQSQHQQEKQLPHQINQQQLPQDQQHVPQQNQSSTQQVKYPQLDQNQSTSEQNPEQPALLQNQHLEQVQVESKQADQQTASQSQSSIALSSLTTNGSATSGSSHNSDTDRRVMNEINRPLFQLDRALPIRSAHKQLPLPLRKTLQHTLASSPNASSPSETRNRTKKEK